MPNNTQTTAFPQEEILVVNPVTRQVINVQPWIELLHKRYQFDTSGVVQDLDDVLEYVTREPREDEPASRVLSIIRSLKALLVAHDSLNVYPAAQ